MKNAHRPLSVLVAPALLALSISSGCAAMVAQHNAALDRAITLSPVNQHAYTKVAVDSFFCSDGGQACDASWGQQASDQFSITLSRLGYQVFDSQQFHTLIVAPPVVVVESDGAVAMGASVQVGPDGVMIQASDGEEQVTVSAGAYGASASVSGGGTQKVVMYESLPIETRQVIIQRSGIAAVASGRITVSPPDSTTEWRDVHVMVRLSDAGTGAVVWQGEWQENASEGETAEVIRNSLKVLNRALERKAPLQGPPPQQL